MYLKFVHTDNGNCRVYYREGRKLRCFQLDGPVSFALFACSRDGEPDFELSPLELFLDKLREDDTATAREFRAWVSTEIRRTKK